MIRYDLVCKEGHRFDGWFRDSAAYDAQAAAGLVTCAVCGTTKVDKQLMTPGLPVRSNRKAAATSTETMMAPGSDPRARAVMDMMREVRRTVEANAEYVGPRFADEARKIHYKEAEQRGIYGEATREDAEALVEEGIEVHPLPRLPEDGN